jgi:hypothetical protein
MCELTRNNLLHLDLAARNVYMTSAAPVHAKVMARKPTCGVHQAGPFCRQHDTLIRGPQPVSQVAYIDSEQMPLYVCTLLTLQVAGFGVTSSALLDGPPIAQGDWRACLHTRCVPWVLTMQRVA